MGSALRGTLIEIETRRKDHVIMKCNGCGPHCPGCNRPAPPSPPAPNGVDNAEG